MKVLRNLFVVALLSAMVSACCCGGSVEKFEGVSKSQVDSVSYAIGVSFSGMIKGSELTGVNLNKVLKGLRDGLADKDLMIPEEQAGMVIQNFMIQLQEAKKEAKDREQQAFLDENITKDGVVELESGVQYKIELPGNDIRPLPNDTVEVHYVGKLLDGSIFDSSLERKEPAKLTINGVIQGMKEGLTLVGEGGKVTLWIPYELGYGQRSLGPQLPAFSTLVFDLEVLRIIPFEEK